MTDKAKPKAVIYTRSAINGAFSNRADQEKRCSEHAALNGYTVIEAFADYGSGNTADRPGIRALLGFLAAQDSPPVVLVDDVSRLARSVAIFHQLREAIQLTGSRIESHSIQEGEQ